MDADFSHRGRIERSFNRLLITQGANRVMLNVRPLFSGPDSGHAGMIQARKEKPERPLHAIYAGINPLTRFIGHVNESINHDDMTPWVKQLALWIK